MEVARGTDGARCEDGLRCAAFVVARIGSSPLAGRSPIPPPPRGRDPPRVAAPVVVNSLLGGRAGTDPRRPPLLSYAMSIDGRRVGSALPLRTALAAVAAAEEEERRDDGDALGADPRRACSGGPGGSGGGGGEGALPVSALCRRGGSPDSSCCDCEDAALHPLPAVAGECTPAMASSIAGWRANRDTCITISRR